jgi:hypothetical protein
MRAKKKSIYWRQVLRLFAKTSACGMVGFMKPKSGVSDNLTIAAEKNKEENNNESNISRLPVKRRRFSG